MARYLGIDIGEAAVRAVVLRTRLRGVVVESMREVSVREAGSVQAALRLVAQGPRPDATAVALPGDGLFLRRLELPVTALRELHNVLGFELEATLPIDLAEAVFDHRLPARRASARAAAR